MIGNRGGSLDSPEAGFYFRANERSSRKSMARPDKVCGTEEDGKMPPGKLY